MSSRDKVAAKHVGATASYFSGSHDWEIYETEDIDHSLVLGSGSSLPVTIEQDEVDYKATEDAAWDDALRNLLAVEKFGELAAEIVRNLSVPYPSMESVQLNLRGQVMQVARQIYDAQVPNDFRAMAEQMRTQDNAITAHPLFVVYQKDRVTGMDTDYTEDDHIVWYNSADVYEADERKHKVLERYYNYFGQEPENWTRTGYVEKKKFVTACFTRAAAENYIQRNRHNLKKPFVYVESMYRNFEMIEVREFLEKL